MSKETTYTSKQWLKKTSQKKTKSKLWIPKPTISPRLCLINKGYNNKRKENTTEITWNLYQPSYKKLIKKVSRSIPQCRTQMLWYHQTVNHNIITNVKKLKSHKLELDTKLSQNWNVKPPGEISKLTPSKRSQTKSRSCFSKYNTIRALKIVPKIICKINQKINLTR